MIEMRIIDNGPMRRPEFQYRHHIFAVDILGDLCPPHPDNIWSEWKTAPYVSLMETEND